MDNKEIKIAGDIIKAGGLVAFPTETVYGLGGNALDPLASKKIYKAKGRPSDNPLIIHIADIASLFNIADGVSETARLLADRFWPGPLTMIFKASKIVPGETTGGLDTVAVRMPSDPIALSFIRAAGGYVAAPSANTSGRPSPTTADHVRGDLGDKIDMILDGGSSVMGLESTIVDMTENPPMILRPGFITEEDLEDVLGFKVGLDPAVFGNVTDNENGPKAPGMKYRHYAPKAVMNMFRGNSEQVRETIIQRAAEAVSDGKKTGILCCSETEAFYKDLGCIVISLGSRDDIKKIASGIYKALRNFDDYDVSVIYSECFDEEGIGTAIMNRLKKAAGGNIISL